MKIFRSLNAIDDEFRGGAVSIGNFDGVHRGHLTLLKRLRDLAEKVNGKSMVFTFDPHPARLLRPEHAPTPLTWTERKAELLSKAGVDGLIAYPTDLNLLSKSPADFFREIIVDQLNAKAMVEGPNFFFGKAREGDTTVLRELCESASIELEILEPVSIDVNSGEMVSSSSIRTAIESGQFELACQMLTEPYQIRGTVSKGAGRGASIGFPTANLENIDTLFPANGVYAGVCHVPTHGRYKAAIHIGPNPTFGENRQKVEIHLLNFDHSIYGQTITINFINKIRDITNFESVDELIAQVKKDVNSVEEHIQL